MEELLKPIFWDTDVKKLDPQKNAEQIIGRILEYGNLKQVHWMLKFYQAEKIIEVVKSSRQLSLKSANFWAMYFQIPKNEVKCLTKSFQVIRKSTWPC